MLTGQEFAKLFSDNEELNESIEKAYSEGVEAGYEYAQKEFASVRSAKRVVAQAAQRARQSMRRGQPMNVAEGAVERYVKRVATSPGKVGKAARKTSITESAIKKISPSAVTTANKAAKGGLSEVAKDAIKENAANSMREVSNYAKTHNGKNPWITGWK